MRRGSRSVVSNRNGAELCDESTCIAFVKVARWGGRHGGDLDYREVLVEPMIAYYDVPSLPVEECFQRATVNKLKLRKVIVYNVA